MSTYLKYKVSLLPPQTEAERQALCGWAGPEQADRDFETYCQLFSPLAICGDDSDEDGAGKSSRNAETYVKVTGHEPDLTPQPTGCCVADGAADAGDGTAVNEIAAGEREEFKPLYSPFIYAVSRVIHLRNQLKGSQGSTGSAAAATLLGGVIPADLEGLPTYNKRNIDLWGDGNSAEGKSFRDYLEQAKQFVFRSAARCTAWEEIRKSLYHGFWLTIASSRGYTMQPGNDGFHKPSGTWQHQMSVVDYCDDVPDREKSVFIKNQWGDVHGRVRNPSTGELMPRGIIRVRTEDFIRSHLNLRGCEVFAFSKFDGFPSKRKLIKVKLFGK
jgi:hypothetical protein